jgi:hypothetical protein
MKAQASYNRQDYSIGFWMETNRKRVALETGFFLKDRIFFDCGGTELVRVSQLVGVLPLPELPV